MFRGMFCFLYFIVVTSSCSELDNLFFDQRSNLEVIFVQFSVDSKMKAYSGRTLMKNIARKTCIVRYKKTTNFLVCLKQLHFSVISGEIVSTLCCCLFSLFDFFLAFQHFYSVILERIALSKNDLACFKLIFKHFFNL